jgi:hypothetical protein
MSVDTCNTLPETASAKKTMTVEKGLRLIAGVFIVATVLLGYFHSPYWLLFTAFVGINLFQSGLTDWCPMVWILEKAGLARCAASRSAQG